VSAAAATRLRQVAPLAPPEGRAAGPGRVVLAGVAAIALTLLSTLVAAPGDALARWPGWGAAALAAGAATLLEDPVAETGAASPTPLPLRRLLRLVLALPPLAIAWLAVLAVAGPDARAVDSVMLSALAAATLGTAAAGLRTRLADRACTAAMALPLLVVGASPVLPGPPPWEWASGAWLLVLAAGSAALAWSSRAR
jgi:hypothetical protein